MKNKLAVCLLLLSSLSSVSAAEPLELNDGDRVILLGSTIIERDQSYGYLETALTTRYPDRNIKFRNLGWSGDTVWGEARAGFDTVADGFRRLKELVFAEKPTVILVGYGTNESFAGEAGLSEFKKGLNTLLDTLAETDARIILLSPIKQEDLGRPLPDPAEQNRRLALYRDAIRETAEQRQLGFIDLYENLTAEKVGEDGPLTDNGLHLTQLGYWHLANVVASNFKPSARANAKLPTPPKPGDAPSGSSLKQVEELRATINLKNELYFHRWRPQNETYLLGFRKHEQGQNAVEIAQFDPLVDEQEQKIAQLKVLKRPTVSAAAPNAAAPKSRTDATAPRAVAPRTTAPSARTPRSVAPKAVAPKVRQRAD